MENLTMESVMAQEKDFVLSSFTHEDAWKIGLLAHKICEERALPVAVCVEHCGQAVFQCGMPGSTPDNDRWMAGKRNIVRLTTHSSLFARLKVQMRGGGVEGALSLDGKQYVCSGGCIPIFVGNVGFVGSLTVSGLIDTQDHALAAEILAAYKQMQG